MERGAGWRGQLSKCEASLVSWENPSKNRSLNETADTDVDPANIPLSQPRLFKEIDYIQKQITY